MKTQLQATASGIVAIVLWGCLAFLADFNRAIAPFQLMAMSFGIGFLVIALKWLVTKRHPGRLLRQSLPVWLLTLFGLFGYHFCYFMALRHAPVLQAALVAYLWPLLIVLLATVMLRLPIRPLLIVGTLISLLGCWLLIYQEGMHLSVEHMVGYGLALACALIWALYSVLLSRVGQVPSDFVGWGCGATAILAGVCHVLLEQTMWPLSGQQWLGVVLLGAGPVGMAFVAWDIGMKRGNVPLLGSLSYLAPLLSSAILVGFADAEFTPRLAAGGVLILSGALAASIASRRQSAQSSAKAQVALDLEG